MNDSRIPIFDGHNDTLLRLYRAANEPDRPYDFFQENETGHLDLPRARKGGLAGGLFAIFTPTPKDSPERAEDWSFTRTENGYRQRLRGPVDPDYARTFTQEVIRLLAQLIADSGGQLQLVSRTADIVDCMRRDVLAIVMHFEGAEAITPDLANLDTFYQQGLRSLGIVWSRPNAFATGVPFCFPESPDTGPGLTDAGRELVRACNRLGIMLDLAHINEKGFWDVAAITDAPLVATHTAAHAICPSTRNITDRQIDAIGESGGVVGLIYEPMNIRADGQPVLATPLDDLVRHIDYISGRIGIDHIALGSDFDGADVPDALGSAAGLQKLIAALRAHGYDQEALEKIAYRNWLRVLGAAWKE